MPKVYPANLPKKVQTRVDLQVKQIRDEFFNKALNCVWFRVCGCPCEMTVEIDGIKGKPGQPQRNCPACRGIGVIRYGEQPIPVVVQSASLDPVRFQIYGEGAHSMVKLTHLPEHVFGFGHRICVKDAWMLYWEKGYRDVGPVTKLRHDVEAYGMVIGSKGDPTEPVEVELGVDYCRRADTAGTILDNELVQDVDFVVTAEGWIDWTLGDGLGTAPAVGAPFSIAYYGHPVYSVRTHPYFYRQTYQTAKTSSPQLTSVLLHSSAALEFYGRNAGDE